MWVSDIDVYNPEVDTDIWLAYYDFSIQGHSLTVIELDGKFFLQN